MIQLQPAARRHRIGVAVALVSLAIGAAVVPARGEEPFHLPRCQVVPLADNQVSLQIDGVEKTRWHTDGKYPRPFFYPFNGPSGASLTRMGHPGAQNHDHHRSVWLAHHDVEGVEFWSENTKARLRQKMWYSYQDGDDGCLIASRLGWYDGQGAELMEADLFARLSPLPDGEHALELQITLRPAGKRESVELGKTNFGFLAVRMAKTIAEHFGGGKLTDSHGRTGEKAIFGQTAKWMDYSGPVAVGQGDQRTTVVEGITYFDHPQNPRYPTRWHVRSDGWMGASFCFEEGYKIQADEPLTLRYLLHAHRGAYDEKKAQRVHAMFAGRRGFVVGKSSKPHRQFEARRAAAGK